MTLKSAQSELLVIYYKIISILYSHWNYNGYISCVRKKKIFFKMFIFTSFVYSILINNNYNNYQPELIMYNYVK